MTTHQKSVLIALVVALLCFFSGQSVLAQNSTSSLTPDISSLETRFFDHTYPTDPIDTRLDRLERMVFGEIRTGSEQDRVTNLLLAVPAAPPSSSAAPASQTTSSPTDQSAPVSPAAAYNQTAAAPNNVAPESTGEDVTESSDYPRITQLEQEILGKTFVNEPIQQRLEQLEIKAFGKAHLNSDLSDRTDALESYADKHFPHPQNNAETAYGAGSYPAPAPPYAQPSGYGGYPTVQTGSNMLPPRATLDQKVTWLEQQVFGASYPTQPLIDRVNKLAANIFPADSPQRALSLADQVASMVGAVELMPKQGSASVAQAQYPAPSAFSQYQQQASQYPQMNQGQYNQPNYPDTQTTAYQNQAASQSTQAAQTPNHHTHTFIRGLAHVLGTVGSMAAGSMMSGAMMGGGGIGGFGF